MSISRGKNEHRHTAEFKASGPITSAHANLYIERQADRDALRYLLKMDYLLIIEPRQQGKTSLLNALMRSPGLDSMLIAYVDVTTLNRNSESAWYQTIVTRIISQFEMMIVCNTKVSDQCRRVWRNFLSSISSRPLQDHTSWRDFLAEISIQAFKTNLRLAIVLDEIGAVDFSGVTNFFSVLREVFNSRQAESHFTCITFILAGAFNPRDLISDQNISPFNIAQRIRLQDFTLSQTTALVKKGGWQNFNQLAKSIHEWTDGQPYLTQLLCSYLHSDATSADVEICLQRLFREDVNHLPPLLNRLTTDSDLRNYVARINAGEKIKFSPYVKPHSKLELRRRLKLWYRPA